MAEPANKKWALDTNVILDLAAGVEAAHALREIAEERGYSLHISQRVLAELWRLSRQGESEELRNDAAHALENLARWDIGALELFPGQIEIAEIFSAALRERGLLPETEVGDGIILAQTSLGGAAILVSSDGHLLSIDPDEARVLFDAHQLPTVPVISPLKLVRLFG